MIQTLRFGDLVYIPGTAYPKNTGSSLSAGDNSPVQSNAQQQQLFHDQLY
jgi:hypothetical protein